MKEDESLLPQPAIDSEEIQEWLEAVASSVTQHGIEKTQDLLNKVLSYARALGVRQPFSLNTAYLNSLLPEEEAIFPGDEALEARISAFLRWNAIAMVMRAGKKAPELGGHIATYASIAGLYEMGFQHFFRGRTAKQLGDCVYFQGHSSPGIYARAFLEGRLTETQLDRFRQEVAGGGLTSYPHPWLMPDFWQFPTVSMGLGALQAIYQARFQKYLMNRGLLADQSRKIWAFCGDGEMDEPESLGALTLPGREQLDNLIFVINCNLQRLDGPVRGNGKIIQELEALFRGAGWHVIKVIWGRAWDALLAQDDSGLLASRMENCLDGEYQNYIVRGPAYFRQHFFGQHPDLVALVADWSDDQLATLLEFGGHDTQKVYAAYAAAVAHKGQPVVILAKTVKGFGMGASGEGLNKTHQQKKMAEADLLAFAQRFELPLTEEKIKNLSFVRPPKQSAEVKYLHQRREALGGFVPTRQAISSALPIPALQVFKPLLEGSGEREISTTMGFVRILSTLLRDKTLKSRIVPIVPDESRTFGMEGLFRQIGIYSPHGQQYEPVDREQVMYYREAKDGQLLEEGINEAGAFASWLSAGTSYSTNDLPMIPFYIYYSMFGFQRIGDLAWAAGDMGARGFLLGATSGRTTLAGEGLQHQDGHSHIMSALIPNCVSYDPTYAYELAVIVREGLRRMYEEQENIYYYITLLNENYIHPAMPEGAEAGIIKGMYCLRSIGNNAKHNVQLLGAGAILREVEQAAVWLAKDFSIASDIWSVTSFTELRRDALAVERYNRLHPQEKVKTSYVTQCLAEQSGPVFAVTDYVRLFADQIRAFVPKDYHVLGTDGYGRSDTRQQLREFFEVNAGFIVYTVVVALVQQGVLPEDAIEKAITNYKIKVDRPDPVSI